jgi:hypothetical protein
MTGAPQGRRVVRRGFRFKFQQKKAHVTFSEKCYMGLPNAKGHAPRCRPQSEKGVASNFIILCLKGFVKAFWACPGQSHKNSYRSDRFFSFILFLRPAAFRQIGLWRNPAVHIERG